MLRNALSAAALAFAVSLAGCNDSEKPKPPPPLPFGPPAISSVTPTSAPVGATVTIRGTNFEQQASLEAVFFGDTEAPIVSGAPDEIVCTVPRGAAPGSAPASVTTRVGTSAPAAFTVAAPGGVPPVVSALAPIAGAPGTTVTISGSGFSATAADNFVTLANVPVAATSASPTALAFLVPLGARAG